MSKKECQPIFYGIYYKKWDTTSWTDGSYFTTNNFDKVPGGLALHHSEQIVHLEHLVLAQNDHRSYRVTQSILGLHRISVFLYPVSGRIPVSFAGYPARKKNVLS